MENKNNITKNEDWAKVNLSNNLKEIIKNKLDTMFISDDVISYKWYPDLTFSIFPNSNAGFYATAIQATISSLKIRGPYITGDYILDKFIIPIKIYVQTDLLDHSCTNIEIIPESIIENALLIGERDGDLLYIDGSRFKELFIHVRSIDWKYGYLAENRIWVGTYTGHDLSWNLIKSIKSFKDEFYISIVTDENIQYDYMVKLYNHVPTELYGDNDSFLRIYKLNETILNFDYTIIPNITYNAYDPKGNLFGLFTIPLLNPLGEGDSVNIYNKFVEDVKDNFERKIPDVSYKVKEIETKIALDVYSDGELICTVRLGPAKNKN